MFPLRDTIPSRRPPVAVYVLIALNVAAFLFETLLSQRQLDALVSELGVVPARFASNAQSAGWNLPFGAGLTLFTSQFLHGGLLHLLGNLWTLWIFGDNVEDHMGSARFVAFYLLAGVAAGVTHILLSPGSTIPTIGASGAIAGVMGAYLVMFPKAHVILFVPLFILPLFFRVPAVVFLGVWFAMQSFAGAVETVGTTVGVGESAGVAYWAHVGGFVAGLLTFWMFRKPRAERRELYRDEWGLEQAWR